MRLAEAVILGRVPEDTLQLEADFVALYRATFRRIYAFVRARVADAETAQDLTSRVYLKAYRLRTRAPSEDRRLFWLLRVASTTVIDYYRTESPRQAVTIGLDELPDLADTGRNPEERLMARERAARLIRAMSELRARERDVLVLKFACRQTNEEIGEVLGLSPAAVSMRLMRALRRLRRHLEASEPRP